MISTRTHGILDYTTGLFLIIAPYVFDFAAGGPEQWFPMFLGALTIFTALMTNYEFGAFRLIPMPVHLSIDMVNGALLAASPWLFGFSAFVWFPHLLVGLIEIIVPLFTRRELVSHRSADTWRAYSSSGRAGFK